jgi:hypothetical protein
MNCSDAVFLGRQQFLRAARQDLHEPIARAARLALRDSRFGAALLIPQDAASNGTRNASGQMRCHRKRWHD